MAPPRVPHILIVGGGFAGVYAAKTFCHLFKPGEARITLLAEHNYFLFAPLLHEVATGGLSPSSVVEPLLEIFRGTCVTVVTGRMAALDPSGKVATTKDGSFPFDYLVLATGSMSQIDIPTTSKNIFPLKNLDDAIRIRATIIELFQKVVAHSPFGEKKLLAFVVVGAGHTGTESVMELSNFIKGTLVPYYTRANITIPDIQISLIGDSETPVPHSTPAVQGAASRALRRAGIRYYQNAKASSISETEVILANGIHIPSHLVLWTAGTVPAATEEWKLPFGKNKRIYTNQFLQVYSLPHIFAIGDVAGTDPRLAQVAEAQGIHLAKNITALIRGNAPTPFQYHSRGFLMSLGRGNATGDVFGIPIWGPWGWWIWRTVYLFKFLSWRKRFRIALEWTIRLFTPRDITVI